MIKFKDLPKKVQEAMLDEQERQGNTRDEAPFIELTRRDQKRGGFNWPSFRHPEVTDSVRFWEKIIVMGDYSDFYKIFGPEITTIKIGEDTFNV